jgi:hypothetical protein
LQTFSKHWLSAGLMPMWPKHGKRRHCCDSLPCSEFSNAALELCVSADSTCKSKGSTVGDGNRSSSSPQQPPGKRLFVSGTKTAQEVEGFMDSLSRNGFLAAPPNEFLALMTDWRSARTNSHGGPQYAAG